MANRLLGSFLCVGVVASWLSIVSPCALAQPAVSLDLPAQPLADALRMLGKRADTNILIDLKLVGNLQAAPVKGMLTLDQALAQMLAGTNLGYRFLNDKTVVLTRAGVTSGQLIPDERMTLAQNAGATNEVRDADAPQESSRAADDKREGAGRSPAEFSAQELTVTGSRLRQQGIGEGPQPVNVYTREVLEKSGQSTLAGFLNTLPEVSTSFREVAGIRVSFGQTSVQLRGLPVGTTLTLVNGRRVESGGANAGTAAFFDLNSIPAAAVERIEVLPQGSSAIYGGGALAGVVNIVMRKEQQGLQTDFTHGAADGTSESTASLGWGHRWERGSLSLVGSYFRRDALEGYEREVSSSGADFRAVGGPDFRLPYCNPGNVYSLDGANLPGLSASSAGAPRGLQGAATVQDFVATAGQPNVCSLGASQVTQIPKTERVGLFAYGNLHLTGALEAFTELTYTENQQLLGFYGGLVTGGVLSGANPYNPFGTNVRVTYQLPDAYRGVQDLETRFTRALVGLRGELPGNWDWELAAWQARDRSPVDYRYVLSDAAALSAALSSSDPAQAFNPFAAIPASAAVVSAIYPTRLFDSTGELRAGNVFARGKLVELPAGALDVVIGGEFYRESITANNPYANYEYDRDGNAVFVEGRIPLMAPAQAGGVARLAASIAARRDHSSDFGNNMTYQFGLEVRPENSLLIRAAHADSYRAPNLYATSSPSITSPTVIFDPARGGESYQTPRISGGNPQLRAEQGSSQSIGVVWTPTTLKGLKASMTGWRIEQEDRVTTPNNNVLLNNATFFPGRVVREPAQGSVPGRVTLLDARFLNFGRLEASGIDGRVSYDIATARGVLTPSLGATWFAAFDATVVPNQPTTSRLNVATADAWAPRWKAVVGLDWQSNNYSLGALVRYTGSYLDYQDSFVNNNQLGDFAIVDLNARYDLATLLPGMRGSRFEALKLSAGIINVFNALPERSFGDQGYTGYDISQYDIRGRFAFLSLGMKW